MTLKNSISIFKNSLLISMIILLPTISYLMWTESFTISSKASEVIFDQARIKRQAYKESYPDSLSDYENFLGFDYTGKLKQIYNNENQYEKNGSIFLSAQNKYTVNPTYNYQSNDPRHSTYSANYSGGKLMLKEKFTYGHLQIRAKIPNIPGTLPAMWLINNDNPNLYSEIDILEVPGTEKNNAYAAVHWGPNQWSLKNKWGMRKMPTISSDYHWYDIYRYPDYTVILYDGVKVLEYDPRVSTLANGTIPLNEPMQLVFNFNIGDKWAGEVDNSKLPAAMEIAEVSIRHYR
jgi:beta-glucanase (GH16 family)